MTSTIDAPTRDADPVPGVDRRHRPSDFFHERTNFGFMRRRRTYLVTFAAVVLISIAALVVRDLNLGIDVEGGVSWQVEMAADRDAKVAEVRDRLEPLGFGEAKVTITSNAQTNAETIRVQAEVITDDPVKLVRDALAEATGKQPADVTVSITGAEGTFAVDRVATPDQAAVEAALATIEGIEPTVTVTGAKVSVTIPEMPASPRDEVTTSLAEYAGAEVADVSINTVGPTWGNEVSKKALQALFVFFLVLALYLTLRFEFKMAAAAIVAVVHDIIFTVGIYAIFGFPVSPATVTAFLTILGFSLYDTVVVFDTVKENTTQLGTGGRATYSEMMDKSLNQVLMRSLSTSLVALLPVISLLVVGVVILGATALEDFALALLAGLFIGTYSSLFVAAPLLCTWKEREPQYRALRDRSARTRATAPGVAGTAGAAVGTVVAASPEAGSTTPSAWDTSGVPGPPAVPRSVAPKPRQQRGRKRK